MAYTQKPSQPPTSFSAAAHDKFLDDVSSKLFGKVAPASTHIAPWKRWTDSTDPYDGVDKGGIRDVLNAGLYGLDNLKTDHDRLDQREKDDVAALSSRVAALEARPQIPFPGSSSPGVSRPGLRGAVTSRLRSLGRRLRRSDSAGPPSS